MRRAKDNGLELEDQITNAITPVSAETTDEEIKTMAKKAAEALVELMLLPGWPRLRRSANRRRRRS